MGVITVIHTFGADLKWHPHLHLLVTEGGLSLDGERWVEPYKLGWLRAEHGLKKMWRYHVITAFRQAHRKGKLRFPANSAFMKNFPGFNWLLQQLYDLTWYAHIGACLLDPTASLRYIGRYTKRAVLAEYRITDYDGKKVRFAFKDYAQGGRTSFKTMPVLAFIGRLIRHVPDKHFKMVRYSGIFAPRWKGRYLEQARRALPQAATTEAVTPEPATSLMSWHERQTAQGRDPLHCAACHQPMVLVEIAFGPRERIARLFQLAGKPVHSFHPATAMGP